MGKQGGEAKVSGLLDRREQKRSEVLVEALAGGSVEQEHAFALVVVVDGDPGARTGLVGRRGKKDGPSSLDIARFRHLRDGICARVEFPGSHAHIVPSACRIEAHGAAPTGRREPPKQAKATAGSVRFVIPEELLARALRQPNGELLWQPKDAAEVIRIVTTGGCRVLGLDLDQHQRDRGYVEEPIYVSGHEASNEEAAAWALQVLEQEAGPSDRVLVTWSQPAAPSRHEEQLPPRAARRSAQVEGVALVATTAAVTPRVSCDAPSVTGP